MKVSIELTAESYDERIVRLEVDTKYERLEEPWVRVSIGDEHYNVNIAEFKHLLHALS